MKKLFYSLVLFVTLFQVVVPVKAAPPTQETESWSCYYNYGGCPPGLMSPYYVEGFDFNMVNSAQTLATIECDPRPTCINDYDVYFYVTWFVEFDVSGTSNVENVRIKPQIRANPPSTIHEQVFQCGIGTGGSCSGYWTGVIPASQLPTIEEDWDVEGKIVMVTNGNWPVSATLDYTYTFSLIPITVCDTSYTELETFTYEIDPLIELPLGPAGAPPDFQIFPMEIGAFYQVQRGGSGWNDGTADRQDLAISWDAEIWIPLIPGNCFGQGESGEIDTYYITAMSETFYIRVNDEEAAFADNTNVDPEDPVVYTVGEVVPFVPCENQFSFDPVDDLISEVTVEADDEDGEQASNTIGLSPLPPLVVQEWYAITVTNGTWQDEGIAPDRTDMEFQVTYNTGFDLANYADLGDGGDGVWCQSTDETTWYIQARSTNLFLRVNNDEITGWGANTGALDVSVYNATFNRPREACEYNYEPYGSPNRQEVSGSASNGKSFAYLRAEDDPFYGAQAGAGAGGDPFFVEATSWSVRPLEAGAWYILDTIEGPWMEDTSSWNEYRFDMAVNVGDGEWIPLEDWVIPCNVALDALGHRRLYFQVPTDQPDGLEWFLRVDDTSFADNGGYMAWNLYRSIEVDFENPAFNPWQGCLDDVQNSYDVIAFNSWIPVRDESGTYLNGNLTGGVGANGITTQTFGGQVLEVGGTYNLQIGAGPWYDEDNDASPSFEAAVSSDNGVTWYPINAETPGAECLSVDQNNRYWMYKFTVENEQIWKIRVNDETGDFGNNGGNLAYNLSRIRNLYGIVSGAGASNFCAEPLLRPTPPSSILDLSLWLNYVSEWIGYSGSVIRRYFAFCPSHVSTIMARMQAMKNKEPLASVTEAQDTLDDVRQEIESYDWGEGGSGGSNTSLFGITNLSDLEKIWDRIFPKSDQARAPWEGGDIIDVSDFESGTWEATSSYNTCYTAFAGELPVSIVQGVCFVSAAFRDTGASFWIQLSSDISVIIGFVLVTKRPLQEVIYMMTGVRPWTRSGAESGLDKLIGHLERREGEVDRNAQELTNRFGGNYGRNPDGTYSRRR